MCLGVGVSGQEERTLETFTIYVSAWEAAFSAFTIHTKRFVSNSGADPNIMEKAIIPSKCHIKLVRYRAYFTYAPFVR